MTWKRKRRRCLPRRKPKSKETIIKAGRLGASIVRTARWDGRPTASLRIGELKRSKHTGRIYVGRWIGIRLLLDLPLLATKVGSWLFRECLKDKGFRKYHTNLLIRWNASKPGKSPLVRLIEAVRSNNDEPEPAVTKPEPTDPRIPLDEIISLKAVLDTFWAAAAKDFQKWEDFVGSDSEKLQTHVFWIMEDLHCFASETLLKHLPIEKVAESDRRAMINGSVANLEVVPN